MPATVQIAPGWTYRRDRRCIEENGNPARISPIEYRILECLFENRGRCLPRQELIDLIWGDAKVSDNTLDTHLSSLRRKSVVFASRVRLSRGRGYWWNFEGAEET
ncbi:MAG: winged helix-turn-helix domain-containing protein [Calothrix sp. SM1_5_4]|nr:winged helix-turn-helix domain-containing protein [Calothrix sp. SM1_5_4]